MTIGDVERSAIEALQETVELQRLGCEFAGSPLYGEILDGVAADVAAQGVCARVLEPYAFAPTGDAVVLRLLAAMHHLVLSGTEPDLAMHYPSVGGRPEPGLVDVFLGAVARHEAEVVRRMHWPVQTNEPGRSATLLGGFLEAARFGLPLRVLEVGASAGLNLRFDHFRYEAGGRSFGPSDAELRFVEPWAGLVPALDQTIEVAERRASDLEPIDPLSDGGRRRLRSLVWPDQRDRLARLDAALAVAARLPVTVERAGAVSWLGDLLAEPAPGRFTVVVHSIVLQYLSASDRRAMVAALEAAGARATADAPLGWLRMEPGGEQAEPRLTVWPGGTSEVLARSAYHGPPVHWLGATAPVVT